MSNQLIHADVYMIPCYGQSLSLNTSAGQSTFDDIEPLSYDSELRNTNIQDMCAGTAEGRDHPLRTTPQGQAGKFPRLRKFRGN